MSTVASIAMILILIVLIGILFMRYFPAFGGKLTPEQVHTYNSLHNFSKGKFVYDLPSPMDISFRGYMSMVKDSLTRHTNRRPREPLPMVPIDFGPVPDHETRMTWLGHSALLLQMNGKTILIDPMFGSSPSPFPGIGSKRYSGKLPFEIEDLPPIDAVILSHDHYDHLDYGSINKLKEKIGQFFVPLGVGRHLRRWGIEPGKIQEFNWWDEGSFGKIHLACTPARHFSGRSLGDRDTSLWCSWVIESEHSSLFFSGDGGYGPHFAKIGEKYGPFDLTTIECGQYDSRWPSTHMIPEETVQAHLDVKGKLLIPIHWGGFTLAFHDWTDSIERAAKEAKRRNTALSSPKIGEPVIVGSADYPHAAWWK
ncbi:MBL fold metallo-hydrolase [Paenibacillus sp. GP183]|uniref:MBL fold metallo-hydrolase n=1 Tax=Paenibacillus sp. GP183 TaxID=1882751 RepID=UPI00089B9A3D|nr:MBL fold metallo-hydrolase [Paenibacillus sp. GP183]SEB81096.1 L-ascorbate metabolism protein UlaG, beta-lactamase superfamily [Paenibacillus sp. GP183]